jgi:hypothetical protein
MSYDISLLLCISGPLCPISDELAGAFMINTTSTEEQQQMIVEVAECIDPMLEFLGNVNYGMNIWRDLYCSFY